MRPQPCSVGRDVHAQNCLAGFAGRDQMAHRADPANARHQRRHLIEGPVLAELLESAQLGDVQARVSNLAVVTQLYGHLGVTFYARYRIDDNCL